MSSGQRKSGLGKVRLATLLFPPAGLVLLWRHRDLSVARKVFGTAGIALFSVLYAALIAFLLVQAGVLQVEWRGGFPPVLTMSKTVPDYDAVEAHRAAQAEKAIPPTATDPSGSVYWTGFRGPDRNGHYEEMPIRTNWPDGGLKPVWKQPIGGGYASFAIARGRAYTIEQRRGDEAVTCYDVATGRELWAHSYPAFFSESMGGDGPRSTPTYDDGRIYAIGATGEFHCLDAETGDVLWRKNILAENNAQNLQWAQSASPLIVDEKVIVCPGGSGGRSVVAYDKVSGAFIWGSLNDDAAYSSPMLVELAGRRQLLVPVLDRVVGLVPETGALLWEFPWTVQMNNRNIAQPVLLGENRFLLSAGYGTGCVAVEVTREGDRFITRELWRNRNLKNKFTSSVFHENYVFGLDEDILVCLDAATGQRMWKDGRYDYGQVLLASGQLIVQCGNGDLAVVRATPERHEQLMRFPVLDGKTWNHPAMSGAKLLIRNSVEMACYDLSPQSP